MSVCSNAHVTDWYRVAQTVFTPSKIGHYVDDLEICINHRETAKINFELRLMEAVKCRLEQLPGPSTQVCR